MEIILNSLQNAGHLLTYYVIPVVIVLGIMIFFHELGHFLVAKLFNVRVLKFALGFGPKIAARVVGETEYSVRYIPLGGFVKMLGEEINDEESEEILPYDEDRAFNRQHPLKRIAIVAAGPVFNLILAVILFWGLFWVKGDIVTPAKIHEVVGNSPAQAAGLEPGDLIIRAKGTEIKDLSDFHEVIDKNIGVSISLTVLRGEKEINTEIIPEGTPSVNDFGEPVRTGKIGISVERVRVSLNIFEAAGVALDETWQVIRLTCLVVVKLFQGSVSLETVGGPIMIGQLTGEIVQENVIRIIPFMAMISINLAILNLFPIPILDGGVILFLLFELALRRPVSLEKQEFAQKIGLSLLLLLMMVVFYNDILRVVK